MKKRFIIGLLFLFNLTGDISLGESIDHRGEVEFQPNEEPVAPVDPETGEEIIPGPTPTNGPLSISYVTDLRFGKHAVSKESQRFFAKNEWVKGVIDPFEKEYPAFVQVNDLRGNAAGWTLLVSQTNLFKNEKGTAIKSNSFIVSAVDVTSPHQMTNSPAGLHQKQTVTSQGELVPIVKANEGEGTGTWHIYLGNKRDATQNVKLTIPQSAIVETGNYSTSLKWVLQDAL